MSWKEPRITINNVELTSAQAMAVRVAIESMYNSASEPGELGTDELGECIRKGYAAHLEEVSAIIHSVKL